MTVLVVKAVRASLRGELSRWLLEPATGVFVGKVSARVRDKLWEKVCKQKKLGWAVLVTPARNEQGFTIQVAGDPQRVPVDFEGITLIRKVFKDAPGA